MPSPLSRALALLPIVLLACAAWAEEPARLLTLAEAIERGRAAQPALRAARDNLAAAHERVGEAFGGYLPQVSASGAYQLSTANFVLNPGLAAIFESQHGSANGQAACLTPAGGLAACIPNVPNIGENSTAFNFYSLQLNVSETIWDFGRTSNAVGQADASEKGSEQDLATALHQVDLNVRTAYFTALADQQLVDVAAEQVEDQKKHLALAQARLEVGAAARYDVSLALSNEKTAEVALIQAKNNFDVARATLNQAMGDTNGIDYRLAPVALETSYVIPEVEAGTQRALAARPDYRSATRRIEAQRRVVDAQRATFYPSIAAAGNFGWTGYDLPLIYNWQVGATLTVPLLNGGIDLHKLREDEATLDSLVAARETLALQVRLDVQSAVLSAQQAKASLDSAEAAVHAGEDALALAEGRYQTGAGSIVDLTDAQVTEVTAKAGLIQANYAYEAALAKLRYALGED